jgi:Multiubiquitin
MSEHVTETEAASPEQRTITIEVNNKPFEAPKVEMTGAEIKTLAGVPPDFQLYLLHGDSQRLDPIADDKLLKLHEHERFRAVSGQDVS